MRPILRSVSPVQGVPTEFLIFRKGPNRARKYGETVELARAVWDEKAAQTLMASYAEHGVDVMIDLEHESLGEATRPDSRDARGWCKLALRNGDLWAVDVRWTPDGRRRLIEKTQRYISPAFYAGKDERPYELVNIALVAMPATDAIPALVAASANRVLDLKRRKYSATENTMDPDKIKAAIDALKAEDGAAALTILEELIAAAAGAGEVSEDPDPAADPTEASADPPAEEEETPEALSALLAEYGLADVDALVAKHRELQELSATVEARRTTLDEATRRGLVGQLVQLGAETPATAWDGEGAARTLKPELAAASLDSLRARVSAFSAARKVAKAPITGASKFSAKEIESAKKLGITPEEYTARRAKLVRRV